MPDMDIRDLLGRPADDPLVVAFLGSLGEDPELAELKFGGEDDGGALLFHRTGLQVGLDEAKAVKTIHLFGDGQPDYARYPYALPGGLSFARGRDAARALLGAPSESGGPVKAIIGDTIRYWDRWDLPTLSLHLRYPEDLESIELLTLMRPAA
jgi:hypothetical protein